MEDRDLKKLLEENLRVSEETLKMTKKLRRDQWYHRIFNVLKWLVILGIAAWAYTQVEPVLQQFLGTFSAIEVFSNSLPGF